LFQSCWWSPEYCFIKPSAGSTTRGFVVTVVQTRHDLNGSEFMEEPRSEAEIAMDHDGPLPGLTPQILEHLGFWEEVRRIISGSELITGFPYTYTVPGLPQYLQSLTKLAIAAVWTVAAQAGEQNRDVPISFSQLLESSFPEVRLLTLEALLERFSTAASALGEKGLPPLLWNMGGTFLTLVLKENHPECLCKILKILHCLDPSEWLPQTEHRVHLSPKEFLIWTMDIASHERSEIQSEALRLASKVNAYHMQMCDETRDLVAPNLQQWVQLVVSSCGDHLPTESRLAAAEVLASTAPFFLTNPQPILGLQDTLALWKCVLTLLQSEEQVVRDAATETVMTAMSQENTCQYAVSKVSLLFGGPGDWPQPPF
ncbi:hypothetical protein Celaphus_00005659, partial [Cervus elaphus hippelaphus]